MKLEKILEIKGTIELVSGLHIGSGDMEMHIGGTDNPVIKHPHTDEPFIPGSSIKGKVRSLLELTSGAMGGTRGEPLSLKNLSSAQGAGKDRCLDIVKIFGSSGDDGEQRIEDKIGPTRVSFADCMLDPEWKKAAEDKRLQLFEVKSENAINRISGTAQNPRFTERVPAGTKFAFSVTLKVFEGDDNLPDLLLEGLGLLELDYLGGSGSRGYGRVRFEFENEDHRAKVDTFKRNLQEGVA